jgi:hypothetical protein
MNKTSLVLSLTLALGFHALAADLYVASNGNDANAGTSARPFATLERARDAIRDLKQVGALREAVTVHVRAGTYFLARPVEFKAQDSGSAAVPITYLADRGATVRVTGGREVTGWQEATDAAVLGRLAPEARGKVMVADLRVQNIPDVGGLSLRGFGAGNPVAEAELFFEDAPMTLARWPNQGFQKVKGKESDQTIIVDTNRVGRWSTETDPRVFAYWCFDWAELYEPLAGVDAAKPALLRTQRIKPAYSIKPADARWYGFNLLSELDMPGEYYLDRTNRLLYFWPSKAGGRAVLSLTEGLVRAENLTNVTFRGFTLEACRGTAISLKGGADCHVTGCTIRNTGQQAVQVSGGERHEVYGCDIYFTGTGGISMSGGDRKTLTPAHHNAENNHVHQYARRARTYHPGISVSGVGNRIAHNLVYDGPHMALSAGGNDHVVEYNEIHNVVEESGDAGAYYVGRDWTQRGNVLRYNYWHDILGSTGYGGMTIYLDDQHCGHTIYGNLFERCMQSVFLGGGNDHVVTNNLFIGCWKSAHLDDRGMNWQKTATDDPKGELRSYLRAMPYTNELWSARYPTLVNILNDDPGVPKRNVYAGNISAGGKWEDISRSIRKFQVVTNNLAFDDDKDWAQLSKDAAGRPVQVAFKDPAAVKAIGFAPLPLEKMGLYPDERRASWPVRHLTRPVKLPEAAKPKK